MRRAPVLSISHGAATLTVREGDPTDRALREAAVHLAQARAVLMISAHDVRPRVTVGRADRVRMWADHPAATGLSWEAPADPLLADAVLGHLAEAGVDAVAGSPLLDHGAWVPLRALDPKGERPVVTVSLAAHLDPLQHLALGHALAPLRQEGVAILTSGGLTHNQQAFREGWFAGEPIPTAEPPSARFEAWALEALAAVGLAREQRLLEAASHPDFGWVHPTLDHWLTTLVAAGAAHEEPGRALFRGFQHSLSTALVGFGAGSG